MLKQWLKKNREREEDALFHAIECLKPHHATGGNIARLAFMSPGKVYSVIDRLEDRGAIVGSWYGTETHRRRVYSLPAGHDS